MDLDKIKEVVKDEPKFRLRQIYQAIFSHSIKSWEEASNLSKTLRDKLKKEASLDIDASFYESKDKKTIKASISFGDDLVETVLMRHSNRNTVCVSSQIGCPMGCLFCLTGDGGFKRNLTFLEIVYQVLLFNRYLKKDDERVTNVVFMGMGEPFLNYDEVMKAVKFLNDKDNFNIGARRISISTVGIVEGIKKLAKEPWQVNLAVSVHTAENSLRSKIMPANEANPLKDVLKATGDYIEKTGRKVMIEYLMLKGVNDREEQASKLAKSLKDNLGSLFVVNLISYNSTKKYESSSPATIARFKNILLRESIEVVQRHKLGRDVEGACGQLSSKNEEHYNPSTGSLRSDSGQAGRAKNI